MPVGMRPIPKKELKLEKPFMKMCASTFKRARQRSSREWLAEINFVASEDDITNEFFCIFQVCIGNGPAHDFVAAILVSPPTHFPGLVHFHDGCNHPREILCRALSSGLQQGKTFIPLKVQKPEGS